MGRKHIITISGKPGSGKSSTADRTAELLGYTRHSSGDMVRRFVAEHKMTLSEYNKLAGEDPTLDEKVDQQLRDLRDHDDIVVDSRLGFYWIPESFKVYLDLDITAATKRIYTDASSNIRRQETGEGTGGLAHLAVEVRERMEQEQRRFQTMYHIDPYSLEHFDLIIDTAGHNPKSVSVTVCEAYKRWLKSNTWEQEKSAIPPNTVCET